MSALKPLEVKNPLAPNPTGSPLYAAHVKNRDGTQQLLADPRAIRALVALMNQHAVIGGAAAHWGGPAAFAEMMSSIHAIMYRATPWFHCTNFVNDAGHTENGLYALKAIYQYGGLQLDDLKGFRSIESRLTGHGEAHLYPEGVTISNGPLGSGLPQAQGLCLADKLIGNNRATVCTLSDGGSMEGEAREAFAAIPGLAARDKLNPFILAISDNNTKLSGRISEDSFSMEPTFNSLATLGWHVIEVKEGNDLQAVHNAMEEAFERAHANPRVPVAVWCHTIKGYGVKATEQSASGGHGYPLKAHDPKLGEFVQEIYDGEAPEIFTKWAMELMKAPEATGSGSGDSVKREKVQAGIARGAIAAVKKGLPVYSVSADLQGSTGMAAFHKEFPERSLDVGVAESNMISTAVGLSKQGFIPIVDTFAQFAITKGNLPLIMAGLSQAPIIGVLSHIGFQDAADGASHQATTYLAATSAIPHVQTVQCSCSSEAEELMVEAINRIKEARQKGEQPDSVLFFCGRENHPTHYPAPEGEEANGQGGWDKAQVLKQGEDVTIVSGGPLLEHALAAAEELEGKGISALVINHPFVNRPDVETVRAALEKTQGRLITLEDHQIIGGMGAQLVHQLILQGPVPITLKSLGGQGHFGQSAYKASQLYDKHGMGVQAIVQAAHELLI